MAVWLAIFSDPPTEETLTRSIPGDRLLATAVYPPHIFSSLHKNARMMDCMMRFEIFWPERRPCSSLLCLRPPVSHAVQDGKAIPLSYHWGNLHGHASRSYRIITIVLSYYCTLPRRLPLGKYWHATTIPGNLQLGQLQYQGNPLGPFRIGPKPSQCFYIISNGKLSIVTTVLDGNHSSSLICSIFCSFCFFLKLPLVLPSPSQAWQGIRAGSNLGSMTRSPRYVHMYYDSRVPTFLIRAKYPVWWNPLVRMTQWRCTTTDFQPPWLISLR